MAVLPTGSSQVSVMPQAATVDPRLLAVDNSRFFDGLNQGLGAIGRGLQLRGEATQQRELNESAGMRRRLGEINLANAEEQLASVPDARALRKFQIDEYKARSAVPTVIQNAGSNRYGGLDLSDAANPVFTDLIEEQVTIMRDPVSGQEYNAVVPKVIKSADEVRREYAAQVYEAETARIKAEADRTRAQKYGQTASILGKLQYDDTGRGFILEEDPNSSEGFRRVYTGAQYQKAGSAVAGNKFREALASKGLGPSAAPLGYTGPGRDSVAVAPVANQYFPATGSALSAIQPAAQPARARLTLDQLTQ